MPASTPPPGTITLPDALALLEAAALLHRQPDEVALREATRDAARALLDGAAVRVDLVTHPVDARSGRHELVRATAGAPALVLTVARHLTRVTGRDTAVVELLAGSVASAWELVRLRATARTVSPALLATLTPRELQVLALVAKGATNAQAAVRLGIGTRTVEKHLEHVMGKLDARGRTAAASLFYGSSAVTR